MPPPVNHGHITVLYSAAADKTVHVFSNDKIVTVYGNYQMQVHTVMQKHRERNGVRLSSPVPVDFLTQLVDYEACPLLFFVEFNPARLSSL